MKIPSATGFAVVCTTELAFEYLKQTEQIKLIVLIMKLVRPYSATRRFARVPRSTARFTAVALQDTRRGVCCTRLSTFHHSMLFSNVNYEETLLF